MTDPIERFNELADDYEQFSNSMPKQDEMNETVLELFQQWFSKNPPTSVCELGSGIGTMARTIVDEFKPDQYLALDGAENMVERSIKSFVDYNGPTHVRFEQQAFEEWSPEESFDCVYSSLSIHHMTGDQKQTLFRRIYDSLEPGGLFLYADIFEPPESLADFYYKITRQRRLNMGMTEDEFEERWQSHLENDRPSNWLSTIDWLKEAGFSTVDCAWKNMNRAILLANETH